MICPIIFALLFGAVTVEVCMAMGMPIPNVPMPMPTQMPKGNELSALKELMKMPRSSVKFLNALINGPGLVWKRTTPSAFKTTLTWDKIVEQNHTEKCLAFCSEAEKSYILEKKDVAADIASSTWTADEANIFDDLKKLKENGLICEKSIDALFNEVSKYGQEYPDVEMNLAALKLLEDIEPCVEAMRKLIEAI